MLPRPFSEAMKTLLIQNIYSGIKVCDYSKSCSKLRPKSSRNLSIFSNLKFLTRSLCLKYGTGVLGYQTKCTNNQRKLDAIINCVLLKS